MSKRKKQTSDEILEAHWESKRRHPDYIKKHKIFPQSINDPIDLGRKAKFHRLPSFPFENLIPLCDPSKPYKEIKSSFKIPIVLLYPDRWKNPLLPRVNNLITGSFLINLDFPNHIISQEFIRQLNQAIKKMKLQKLFDRPRTKDLMDDFKTYDLKNKGLPIDRLAQKYTRDNTSSDLTPSRANRKIRRKIARCDAAIKKSRDRVR